MNQTENASAQHDENTDTSSIEPINPSNSSQQNLPINPKKRSTWKIVAWVTAVLSALIVIAVVCFFVFIIDPFVNYGETQKNERDELKQQTVNVFKEAAFAKSSYDCHDVELKNQCFFSLDATPEDVSKYLLSNGFTRDQDQSLRYKSNDLYIESVGADGDYTSYHVSQ